MTIKYKIEMAKFPVKLTAHQIGFLQGMLSDKIVEAEKNNDIYRMQRIKEMDKALQEGLEEGMEALKDLKLCPVCHDPIYTNHLIEVGVHSGLTYHAFCTPEGEKGK